MTLLVHIHTGPEDPDKITLGALIAAHGAARGDDVAVFFAGNAVHALAPAHLERVEGTGFGNLRTHLETLQKAGARVIVSRLSAQSRGYDAAVLPDGAEWGTPDMLLDLTARAQATLCY